jgi:hypothetical protein
VLAFVGSMPKVCRRRTPLYMRPHEWIAMCKPVANLDERRPESDRTGRTAGQRTGAARQALFGADVVAGGQRVGTHRRKGGAPTYRRVSQAAQGANGFPGK